MGMWKPTLGLQLICPLTAQSFKILPPSLLTPQMPIPQRPHNLQMENGLKSAHCHPHHFSPSLSKCLPGPLIILLLEMGLTTHTSRKVCVLSIWPISTA